MKNLLFVSAFDYPTRYAHARHGLEMAKGYHALFGEQFVFFVNTATEGLPVPHQRLFGGVGRRIKKLHLRRILIPLRLFVYFVTHPQWHIVVTTDPMLYAPLGFLKRLFGFRLVFECHGLLTPSQERALQRADLAVFTTKWLQDRYAQHTELRSIVAPNAVDLAAFANVHDDTLSLRAACNLPRDVFLIGYIGRFEPLQMDKGLRFLIDALSKLPDVHLLLLGGAKHEIPAYRAYVHERQVEDRVHIVGHVPAESVPRYAKACDMLAYVPVDTTTFFEYETSPMKLFEYMAAEKPIVISDMRALREVVDESSAYFIRPGSHEDFVHAVEAIQGGAGSDKARAAFEKVKENTWERRAARIVQALGGVL